MDAQRPRARVRSEIARHEGPVALLQLRGGVLPAIFEAPRLCALLSAARAVPLAVRHALQRGAQAIHVIAGIAAIAQQHAVFVASAIAVFAHDAANLGIAIGVHPGGGIGAAVNGAGSRAAIVGARLYFAPAVDVAIAGGIRSAPGRPHRASGAPRTCVAAEAAVCDDVPGVGVGAAGASRAAPLSKDGGARYCIRLAACPRDARPPTRVCRSCSLRNHALRVRVRRRFAPGALGRGGLDRGYAPAACRRRAGHPTVSRRPRRRRASAGHRGLVRRGTTRSAVLLIGEQVFLVERPEYGGGVVALVADAHRAHDLAPHAAPADRAEAAPAPHLCVELAQVELLAVVRGRPPPAGDAFLFQERLVLLHELLLGLHVRLALHELVDGLRARVEAQRLHRQRERHAEALRRPHAAQPVSRPLLADRGEVRVRSRGELLLGGLEHGHLAHAAQHVLP